MKKTNVLKPFVLCLFCLLAFAGCQKKYPGVYEYTGVWDFTIQLDLDRKYSDSMGNHRERLISDSIINYTGRIAHAGGGLLLIEFNQNECIEVGLMSDGKLLDRFNGHNRYTPPMQYYGWFSDCDHLKMFFHNNPFYTSYTYEYSYLVRGTKVK